MVDFIKGKYISKTKMDRIIKYIYKQTLNVFSWHSFRYSFHAEFKDVPKLSVCINDTTSENQTYSII